MSFNLGQFISNSTASGSHLSSSPRHLNTVHRQHPHDYGREERTERSGSGGKSSSTPSSIVYPVLHYVL